MTPAQPSTPTADRDRRERARAERSGSSTDYPYCLYLNSPSTPSLLKVTSQKHVLQRQRSTRNFLWRGSASAGREAAALSERLPLAPGRATCPTPSLAHVCAAAAAAAGLFMSELLW